MDAGDPLISAACALAEQVKHTCRPDHPLRKIADLMFPEGGEDDDLSPMLCAALIERMRALPDEEQRRIWRGWSWNGTFPDRQELLTSAMDETLAQFLELIAWSDQYVGDQVAACVQWNFEGSTRPVRVSIRAGTTYATALRSMEQIYGELATRWDELVSLGPWNTVRAGVDLRALDCKLTLRTAAPGTPEAEAQAEGTRYVPPDLAWQRFETIRQWCGLPPGETQLLPRSLLARLIAVVNGEQEKSGSSPQSTSTQPVSESVKGEGAMAADDRIIRQPAAEREAFAAA